MRLGRSALTAWLNRMALGTRPMRSCWCCTRGRVGPMSRCRSNRQERPSEYRRQGIAVPFVQLELENRQILAHVQFRAGSAQGHDVTLCQVAEQDLRGCASIL